MLYKDKRGKESTMFLWVPVLFGLGYVALYIGAQ